MPESLTIPKPEPYPVRPPGRPALAAAIVLSGRMLRDIAAAVEVNPQTLSRAISGDSQPSSALRQRIARELGVRDVEALFALRDDTDPEVVVAALADW